MLTKAVTQIFRKGYLESLILLSIIFAGVICIYSPNITSLRWGANYAPQIMLFYFGLGIVFFLFKQPKFIFTSFACCAALCVFLKDSTHGQQVRYAVPTNQPELKIAHYNATNFDESLDAMLDLFETSDADILSIQGLDPMLSVVLNEELSQAYPHQVLLPSLSYDGIAVLSKHSFIADTFYYGEKANIFGELNIQGYGKAYFISSHTTPALTTKDYLANQSHLELISRECGTLDAPLITFGDYHLVPWSPEIKMFRETVNLNDSRIGFMPSFIDGSVNFLNVPQDHIFYSNHFKCTSFSAVHGMDSPHLGIVGTFELLSEEEQLSDASLYHPNVAD